MRECGDLRASVEKTPYFTTLGGARKWETPDFLPRATLDKKRNKVRPGEHAVAVREDEIALPQAGGQRAILER
jgi:hypothetical protein